MKIAVVCVLTALVAVSYAATTVDMLLADSKFSTLVSLVSKAGLVEAINEGTFTIFAPTNDAFNKIPAADLTALGNDVSTLTDVLKYHVVAATIYKDDASNELKLTTLNGKAVRINIYSHNNAVTVQGSTISEFDKRASNGVIHTVMMPPTGDIVDLTAGTSDLSTLLKFVQQAGIASALKGDALTVFAPTNAAFARLSSRAVSRLSSDKNLLTEILEYHVVPHTEYSAGLYNREYLATIDRRQDRVTIHASSSGVRVNTNGNVVKADISASHGVVHLIDHVLIPARYYFSLAIGRK